MLRTIRLRAQSVAASLLVALLSATTSQALSAHGLGEHDTDHAPTSAIAHQESDHRLAAGGSSTSSEPFHCLVCHWARAFRPIRSILAYQVPSLDRRAAIHLDVLPAPVTLVPAQLTLRSPPTALFVL
jgi:hypothetical protein